MDTNQIYALVNSVTSQALGSSAIAAVDAQGLISLGNSVLSSQTNTEAFLNTLVQRIGKTILSYRKYTNKLSDLVVDDFTMGAILQKIKVSMPAAETDPAYNLTNGQSVDHYVVAKPTVHQKLFVTRTPYVFHVTVQRETLREAFLSETALGSFISVIFGEVQNKIELALEDLGRTAIANYMAEIANGSREIKLVTNYIADTGSSVTAANAMYDNAFLRYAVAQMQLYAKRFTDMSTLYNEGTETRHTPKEDQRLRILSEFSTMLETVVDYAAFHDEYVKVKGYTEINFWQSAQSPRNINIKRASDGTETSLNNVIGILHDRDALGIYKKNTDVLTTPVNAAGMYYNTYWHEKQLWFNDLSENAVIFTLN